MPKIVRNIDVVVTERPDFFIAQAVDDPGIASLGESEESALDRLEGLIERVLRHDPSALPEPDGTIVSRHVRISVPTSRLGRLLDLELQLFAVCREKEGSTTVILPQLETRFVVRDMAELDAIAGEVVRDTYDLGSRLDALLPTMTPLVRHEEDRVIPLFRVRELSVRFSPESSREEHDAERFPTLSAVGEHLNDDARSKDAQRAFERRAEVETLLDYLSETAERSILLTGAAGVGKTAVVHEAVRRIARSEAPERLADVDVWQVSGGRLMAGMRFLGQWQERVLQLIEEAKGEGIILFAENLIELLETAGNERYAGGIPALLLPHILSGDLVLITEARPEQLARAEQSHPSFLRGLRRMQVEPMNSARADAVLERVSYRLGRQFGVRLGVDARQRILELVSRFKGAAALPGPAVDLAERMARTQRRQGVQVDEEDRPVLTATHALEAYATVTGLPISLLDAEADFSPGEVESFFESAVFAQPEAVEAMTDLVTTIRAGLNSPQRPLGSYIFLGPTGVGKTQTALSLAEYLFGSRDRLSRFDMSEYQDAWSAGRLVGRFQGEQGELVRRVREQPFQVILLDEIEKAHASVFDFLLQVLGEGRLTDGLGQTVSLTSAVVIMTSNLGAEGPSALGFASGDPDRMREQEVAHYTSAVEKYFRPEFVGRVERIIPFRSLGRETARKLVHRSLEEAFSREGLERRRIKVRAEDEVVDFLIRTGLDERYGARPLRRAVENAITAPLAQFLAREGGLEEIELVFRMVDGIPEVELDA